MFRMAPKAIEKCLEWAGLLCVSALCMAQGSAGAQSANSKGDSEVLLLGKSAMSIRASVADLERAKGLQSKSREDLLWARRNGKEYVIQDPSTLEAAHALFSRQAEIGREQREVGARQRDLGERQREIGKQQAIVGKEQQAVGVRRQAPRAAGEPDRLEPEPGPRGEVQQRLKEKQDQLEGQQTSLDAQQQQLAARQQEMAREQEKRDQGITDRFRILVDEALAKGLAQPAN